MRWTKAWFAAAVTASTLACFKSAAKKAAEVRECSRITMNAQGAAQCLVLQYKWKQDAALTAATAYQQQQDSIAQLHADATWRAEAAGDGPGVSGGLTGEGRAGHGGPLHQEALRYGGPVPPRGEQSGDRWGDRHASPRGVEDPPVPHRAEDPIVDPHRERLLDEQWV